MLKWIKGRQNFGYSKLKIFEFKWLKIDCYILYFPQGSYINRHTDPSPEGYEHHRLNIVLKEAEDGGDFYLERDRQEGKVFKFRPDIQEHSVGEVMAGERYVLSIGWLSEKLEVNHGNR